MPSNKKYYWLKLHEEFFNQTVMKYIRKLPEMVGSETVAAVRMRNLREKRAIGEEEMAALPDKGNNVTSCSPDVTGCYPNVPKRYLASMYKGKHASNRVISVIFSVILNQRTSSTLIEDNAENHRIICG